MRRDVAISSSHRHTIYMNGSATNTHSNNNNNSKSDIANSKSGAFDS